MVNPLCDVPCLFLFIVSMFSNETINTTEIVFVQREGTSCLAEQFTQVVSSKLLFCCFGLAGPVLRRRARARKGPEHQQPLLGTTSLDHRS